MTANMKLSCANECSMGKYSLKRKLSSDDECTSCPKGRYSNTSATGQTAYVCELCERGTWGDVDAQISKAAACNHKCSNGRWGKGTGLSALTQCDTCSPGRFSAALGLTADEECTGCERGRWQEEQSSVGNVNNSKCTGACVAGRYQPAGDLSRGNLNNSRCTGACGIGRYQADESIGNTNEEKCNRLCAQGTFQIGLTTGNTDDSKCTGIMKTCVSFPVVHRCASFPHPSLGFLSLPPSSFPHPT